MNEALTDALKEAYALAPANVVVIHTLEIRQIGVQATIHMSQTYAGITATDEESNTNFYMPAGFQFSLPPSNDEGFQTLNVAIDNIDRRVTQFCELAKTSPVPIEIIYRPYLNTDLTQPHMNPPIVLYLKDVQIVDNQVTGRATFADITNKKFPSEVYARSVFPGLG